MKKSKKLEIEFKRQMRTCIRMEGECSTEVIMEKENTRWAVRGISCIRYNIYHLKKLKLCLFNNYFKVRLSKATYLSHI